MDPSLYCIPQGFKFEKLTVIVTPDRPEYALITYLVTLFSTLSLILFGTIYHTINRCRIRNMEEAYYEEEAREEEPLISNRK